MCIRDRVHRHDAPPPFLTGTVQTVILFVVVCVASHYHFTTFFPLTTECKELITTEPELGSSQKIEGDEGEVDIAFGEI